MRANVRKSGVSLIIMLMLLICSTVTLHAAEPKQVTGLKAQAGESEVVLRWNRVSDVSGYYVYQKDPATKAYKKIATVKGASKTTYTVKKLKNNVKVTFCVTAYKSQKGKITASVQSKDISATPKVKTPGVPTLKVNSNASRKTSLTWGKVSTATGYEVYQKVGKSWQLIGTVKKDTKSLTVRKLTNGEKYSFKMRSYRSVGGVKAYSAYSNTVIGRPMAPPEGIENVHTYYYKAKLKTQYKAPRVDGNGSVTLKKGASVTVTSKGNPCKVKTSSGVMVKVPENKLTLTGFITNKKDYYDKKLAEGYVNYKGYSSRTSYLIWVNTYSQHLYVFKGSQYSWKLQKHFMCSTGRFATPSLLGLGTLYTKASPVYFEGCYAYYGSYIPGGAIHSWLYLNGSGAYYADGSLGSPASHGCVRVEKGNAYYIYSNCPVGTAVLVH